MNNDRQDKNAGYALLFLSGFLAGGNERRGQFFVEGEEVLDALAVGIERSRTVAEVNGAVELAVGFHQRGRHRQRVVKVGQRRLGKFLPRVQHRLRGGFHGSALFGGRRFGPGVVVVDEFY